MVGSLSRTLEREVGRHVGSRGGAWAALAIQGGAAAGAALDGGQRAAAELLVGDTSARSCVDDARHQQHFRPDRLAAQSRHARCRRDRGVDHGQLDVFHDSLPLPIQLAPRRAPAASGCVFAYLCGNEDWQSEERADWDRREQARAECGAGSGELGNCGACGCSGDVLCIEQLAPEILRGNHSFCSVDCIGRSGRRYGFFRDRASLRWTAADDYYTALRRARGRWRDHNSRDAGGDFIGILSCDCWILRPVRSESFARRTGIDLPRSSGRDVWTLF
jgi:hypothetical protein